MNSAWIHEAVVLFNASPYKDSEFCFKIYVACFRPELKELWEEQRRVIYCNNLLEGGEGAELGRRQRKSGLCKWLTAVETPQQKGGKANVLFKCCEEGTYLATGGVVQTRCGQEWESNLWPGSPEGVWQN